MRAPTSKFIHLKVREKLYKMKFYDMFYFHGILLNAKMSENYIVAFFIVDTLPVDYLTIPRRSMVPQNIKNSLITDTKYQKQFDN